MMSRNDFNLYRINLYRNDFVSKRPSDTLSLIEKFMPLVLEKGQEGTHTPLCVHQDVTFVYIKYNNLYRQPMQMSRMNDPRVPVPPNYGGMQPSFNCSVAPGANNCQCRAVDLGIPQHQHYDPASTGSESMYAMMKSVPGGSIPAYMGGGPEPPLPLGAQGAPLVMNDSNPDMDGLPKDNQNDHNPGIPGEGDGQFGNLLPFSQDNTFPS